MRHKFFNRALFELAMLANYIKAEMGYVDAQQLFSDAQSIGVGSTVSTNILDDSQDRNVGVGEPLAIVITVDVAAAGGGTAIFSVEADDNAGFSSAATIATTASIAAAALFAGAQVVLVLPADLSSERFMRLRYSLTTMSALTITAYRCPLKQVPVTPQYSAGITVNN